MMRTPGTGWSRRYLARSASAGGQDEQPSDVNSSTSTGTGTSAPPARAAKERAIARAILLMSKGTPRPRDRLRPCGPVFVRGVHLLRVARSVSRNGSAPASVLTRVRIDPDASTGDEHAQHPLDRSLRNAPRHRVRVR